jgi:hypothetical protein
VHCSRALTAGGGVGSWRSSRSFCCRFLPKVNLGSSPLLGTAPAREATAAACCARGLGWAPNTNRRSVMSSGAGAALVRGAMAAAAAGCWAAGANARGALAAADAADGGRPKMAGAGAGAAAGAGPNPLALATSSTAAAVAACADALFALRKSAPQPPALAAGAAARSVTGSALAAGCGVGAKVTRGLACLASSAAEDRPAWDHVARWRQGQRGARCGERWSRQGSVHFIACLHGCGCTTGM